MAQLFTRKANAIARGSLALAPFFLAGLVVALYALDRSPYLTREGVRRGQPVPFSHEHHVAGLGIDCRYCHASVEVAATAGMPATHTCMTCHSQIWADSPMLAPVRDSYREKKPLAWTRVYDLPDFVYFDHSIHIARGVGCVSCHGRIDHMPLTYLNQPLFMSWCLDCHRNPERNLRPREHVFDLAWEPPAGAVVNAGGLGRNDDCYVCHR
jgi:hypothetical protein